MQSIFPFDGEFSMVGAFSHQLKSSGARDLIYRVPVLISEIWQALLDAPATSESLCIPKLLKAPSSSVTPLPGKIVTRDNYDAGPLQRGTAVTLVLTSKRIAQQI